MPKISVIMGVYNGEKTIAHAIDSILNQTYEDFELLICDDSSDDDTVPIIERYVKLDKRVVLLRNEINSGLSVSLNNCIAIAKGKYLARMDDDDISHPTRFEIQNTFLDAHNQYSIVGCCRHTFDKNGVWNTYGVGGALTKEDIIKCNIFTHPTVMMRKSDVDYVGGYTVSKRTIRGQDFDLWCKMYAAGFIGYVLPDVLFDYYEDRNIIKEINVQYRINNFMTHMIWRKKMKLPFIYDLYAYKELLVVLIPRKILVKYKKMRQSKVDRFKE